ncbi:UNVERIFIED_CONTAM: hypothetical protein GTU68_045611, partial [Idotea baltica]|nr:hypothetical protein [Idotea baltica]
MEVPEVLLSGNHQKVAEWREEKAKQDSVEHRPDLFADLKELPSAELSVALIHYPVLNKHSEIVTTSITNLDIHDIARSARTFGLASYYIVHPTKALRRLAEKVCEHWDTGYGSTYNKNRSDALSRISVLSHFDEVLSDIE